MWWWQEAIGSDGCTCTHAALVAHYGFKPTSVVHAKSCPMRAKQKEEVCDDS